MKILIYGAGAIGGYIGGHLALVGHDVTLLGRERLKHAIDRNGLQIIDQNDTLHKIIEIRTTTTAKEAFETGPYDWIAFTMKAYDTVGAIRECQSVLYDDQIPPIVSFQNGVGSEQTLSSAFGHDRIIAGTLTTPVSIQEPGVLIEEKARGIAIASDSPFAAEVIKAFQKTALTVQVVDSSDSLKWSKLLLNMLGNATSAILGMSPAEIFVDHRLFTVEWLALREAISMMELQGIPPVDLPGSSAKTLYLAIKYLPKFLIQPILTQKVSKGRGEKLPSLLIALNNQSEKTEIAWLNGAVVATADSLGRFAPVNHALSLILSDIVTKRSPWEMYRKQPEIFLTAINSARGINDPVI